VPQASNCAFCIKVLSRPDLNEVLRAERRHVVAFEDAFPATPGHTLVIPRRHVARLLDLTDAEYTDLWHIALSQLRLLESTGPDAYTVGVNDGGPWQTVPHVHLHLISRRLTDPPNPPGGVRRGIATMGDHWRE
jgi:diadenosine tetraphosphate (Ap4A) HIT family hydrolase